MAVLDEPCSNLQQRFGDAQGNRTLDTGSEGVYEIAVIPFAQTGKTDDDLSRQSPRGKGLPMRHAALTIAALAVFAAFTPALAEAQTQTEMLEHMDDLGRRNEKLQERVRILESDNKALRERLRELGVEAPSPATIAPPITGRSNAEEQSPAARTLPLPPPPIGTGPVSVAGTIDLDSDPRGAQAATSLGSGCKTPCAMEISADAPFTVTFTHPGYAPATVDIEMQPGQPGVSNPKFSPNPVFVQLTPQSKKKPATAGPQQLGPAR